MSSPMPLEPGICCICCELIPAGANAMDVYGETWDMHAGKCAADAGLYGTLGPSNDELRAAGLTIPREGTMYEWDADTGAWKRTS